MIPDDVEKIIMTKEDYDRNVEQLLLDKCKAELEVERLNNIINGMEEFFKYEFKEEVRPLNDFKVSVWTICLDKLQELKGSNEPSFEEMVNFVENVYQDIKNQSTLDEELREERERIAKIVNNFKGAGKE
jgi:hypothetical protein